MFSLFPADLLPLFFFVCCKPANLFLKKSVTVSVKNRYFILFFVCYGQSSRISTSTDVRGKAEVRRKDSRTGDSGSSPRNPMEFGSVPQEGYRRGTTFTQFVTFLASKKKAILVYLCYYCLIRVFGGGGGGGGGGKSITKHN